jgi:hypothetical protein
LLNTSQTAANNFNAKQYFIMNTHSARKYTMFTPAQLLATGMSSSLATRVTVTHVSQGMFREFIYYMKVDLLLI